MEKVELDLEIAKDQMSFDLDEICQEKSLVLPETLIKPLSHDYIAEEVLFVVAKTNGQARIKALSLSGKTMIEWVKLAGSECEQVEINEGDEIAKLKQIQTSKPIIALFYDDTPLFDKSAFYEIIDYFSSKGMNFLRLNRGLVIKTSYLTRVCGNLVGDIAYEGNALIQIDDAKKINYANKILQERILNYHIRNGVILLGENVYIEADCEIGKGTIIYPNNTILGQSIIEENVTLESGNIIKDSIICSGVKICGCFVKASKISSNIDPLSKIENQKI